MHVLQVTNALVRRCIANCLNGHQICLETVDYLLQRGIRRGDAAFLKLLEDCAEICELTADFLSRGSAFQRDASAVCAKVCSAVVAECERAQDGQLRAMADACRGVAESCSEMRDSAEPEETGSA